MFHPRLYAEPRSFAVVRRALFTLFGLHLILATISGYRAIVQVKSLDLAVPGATLGAGSRIEAEAVSWARTWVTVRVILEQRVHAETLGVHVIPGNYYPAWDFRTRQGGVSVLLTPAILAHFEPGPAVVRATAIGRPQWMRTPPPLVREAHVQLAAP